MLLWAYSYTTIFHWISDCRTGGRPNNGVLHGILGSLMVSYRTRWCAAWRYDPGFPRRLENLENENGHGKVMLHEKLSKNHGIL